MRALIFAIHQNFVEEIFSHKKQIEVRKSIARNIGYPCTAFIYETKNGGGCGLVVGQFRCNGYAHAKNTGYLKNKAKKAALTEDEILKYSSGKALALYGIKDPIKYAKGFPLKVFGLNRAPQSWQYIDIDINDCIKNDIKTGIDLRSILK